MLSEFLNYEEFENCFTSRLQELRCRNICLRRYRCAGCIFMPIPKAAGTRFTEAVVGRPYMPA